MDRFFQDFISFSFKVLPVFIPLWFVIKILRQLTIKNHIQSITKLPDDRKARIIRLYGDIISMNRIGFWISLVCMLMSLVAFVLMSIVLKMASLLPDVRSYVLLGCILFVATLIHFFEDTKYKQRIIKSIENPVESVTP